MNRTILRYWQGYTLDWKWTTDQIYFLIDSMLTKILCVLFKVQSFCYLGFYNICMILPSKESCSRSAPTIILCRTIYLQHFSWACISDKTICSRQHVLLWLGISKWTSKSFAWTVEFCVKFSCTDPIVYTPVSFLLMHESKEAHKQARKAGTHKFISLTFTLENMRWRRREAEDLLLTFKSFAVKNKPTQQYFVKENYSHSLLSPNSSASEKTLKKETS